MNESRRTKINGLSVFEAILVLAGVVVIYNTHLVIGAALLILALLIAIGHVSGFFARVHTALKFLYEGLA